MVHAPRGGALSAQVVHSPWAEGTALMSWLGLAVCGESRSNSTRQYV